MIRNTLKNSKGNNDSSSSNNKNNNNNNSIQFISPILERPKSVSLMCPMRVIRRLVMMIMIIKNVTFNDEQLK